MDHPLTREFTVEETIQRWPQTARVFICRRMACVGCAIAPFETLGEVSEVYQVDADQFLQELSNAAQGTKAPHA
jgi:hybrid cluster-associated redox disulfide protein